MNQILPFIHHHWMLVLLLAILFVAIVLLELYDKLTQAKQIDAATAIYLINREKAHVIDIRPKVDFLNGHIIHAMHILPENLSTEMPKLIKYKNTSCIIVCNTGQQSSGIAKQLTQHHFSKVNILSGGMKSWKQEGLPIETPTAGGK